MIRAYTVGICSYSQVFSRHHGHTFWCTWMLPRISLTTPIDAYISRDVEWSKFVPSVATSAAEWTPRNHRVELVISSLSHDVWCNSWSFWNWVKFSSHYFRTMSVCVWKPLFANANNCLIYIENYRKFDIISCSFDISPCSFFRMNV